MIEAGKVNVTAQGLQALEQVARANGTQDVFAAVLKASAEIDRLTRELAEARAERDAILQAITDPENQPSQYGTVTLAMYEKAVAERDALARDAKRLDWLDAQWRDPIHLEVGARPFMGDGYVRECVLFTPQGEVRAADVRFTIDAQIEKERSGQEKANGSR